MMSLVIYENCAVSKLCNYGYMSVMVMDDVIRGHGLPRAAAGAPQLSLNECGCQAGKQANITTGNN